MQTIDTDVTKISLLHANCVYFAYFAKDAEDWFDCSKLKHF